MSVVTLVHMRQALIMHWSAKPSALSQWWNFSNRTWKQWEWNSVETKTVAVAKVSYAWAFMNIVWTCFVLCRSMDIHLAMLDCMRYNIITDVHLGCGFARHWLGNMAGERQLLTARSSIYLNSLPKSMSYIASKCQEKPIEHKIVMYNPEGKLLGPRQNIL